MLTLYSSCNCFCFMLCYPRICVCNRQLEQIFREIIGSQWLMFQFMQESLFFVVNAESIEIMYEERKYKLIFYNYKHRHIKLEIISICIFKSVVFIVLGIKILSVALQTSTHIVTRFEALVVGYVVNGLSRVLVD